ncbi:ABC transporter ATP-binding protein [Pseudoflavonifractor phocaeensis]|uniref:ABC transporter ATP-binding protein n=1 Tax=Pseudoflavonifractor phocaeensis TaxID=1870988 RepID=UPI00210CE830|nr:dipeptide ABC transporter ATP-binding protein [Pseudoflavonifractor phocaeensis]MCQ4863982.1 dipeptide ABC transporter ATP-binding protein [Pseudoflavonifractor phocaeensis]
MSDIILETRDLKKHFNIKGGRVVKAVDGVSIQVERGKTLGLVGESGCGKSTLGRTIIRIYDPTEGKVILNGKDVSGKSSKHFRQELARSMQMIFQDPYACLNPRMTVSQLIAEGWDLNKSIHLSAAERKEKIVNLLEIVGLNEEHANRFPHEFSGGQRQRIGIARALSMDPELIICDEPISALDVSIQAQVMNLLLNLQQKTNLSYIFIAHDLSMVRYISDTVAVMYLGSIMEYASNKELYEHPQHPYTKALFSAIPVANPEVEKQRRRIKLEGEIPSPINAPKGCKFCTRCSYAKPICFEQPPELKECAPGHRVACHVVGG